jgi:hypothetical protein
VQHKKAGFQALNTQHVEEEQGRTKGGRRMIGIFIFDMQIFFKLSISLSKKKRKKE